MNVNEIWNEAVTAAAKAAAAHDTQLGAEAARGFDCGFAWIEIRPARGAMVKYLKDAEIGRRGYNGGLHVWYSKLHSVPTQSISTHEAAAAAAVDVLVKHGISASWSSRLD